EVGIASAAFMFIAHSIAKSLLFMVSGCIERETNTRLIDKLGGLADRMPLAAISAFIGFLCLSGIPPTLGFWAELEIFFGVFTTSLNSGYFGFIMGIVLLVSSTLTAAYGLSTFKKVFYGTTKGFETHENRLSIIQIAPLVLALLLIVLGTYPSLIVDLCFRY
ncbi:MAG: proton-conducting transporter membrane subunit, partial [Thermofilaceae archaeon]